MRLDEVWFRYARSSDWVLQAITAAVHPGDAVVVLGRNGAGKSTLLQLAAGVLRPVRGIVHDRPRVIGWVPERFPADQPFTAAQYLDRMAAVRGLRADAAAAAVDSWMERLGLAEHRDTRLADLSKGTAQKVGLAQALLVVPELLVLDEPWEGLDAQARTLVPEIVAEVTAAGGAVLISDHRGEIADLPGTVRWLVESARVVTGPEAAHGPLPQEPDGVIVEIGVDRADAEAAVARLLADGHRVLGVRPDDRAEIRQ
jgi:ABC-2 type transport system ATP-binding protein